MLEEDLVFFGDMVPVRLTMLQWINQHPCIKKHHTLDMVEYKAERDVNLEMSKGEKENMYIASKFEIMIEYHIFTRKKAGLLHYNLK